jgi:predicted nucleotidyltransferase component of viral defense system
MNEAINEMLKRYSCVSSRDYENALKEIMQEIALLGLWRSKFFEKASFYGGTALRIFHGLDRFSEDLDFTLLKVEDDFKLGKYNKAVESELKSFGFDVMVETKEKMLDSNIESAFIKAGTKKQLILINVSSNETEKLHHQQLIKIKMEVDVNPAGGFKAEVNTLLQPIPFAVAMLQPPDLFAGKVHALICRNWQNRVKGRDWYDFVWSIARKTPIRLEYLKEKLLQSGIALPHDKLECKDVLDLLDKKINIVDFEQAKKDVLPFIKDTASVELWSKKFFKSLMIKIIGI